MHVTEFNNNTILVLSCVTNMFSAKEILEKCVMGKN